MQSLATRTDLVDSVSHQVLLSCLPSVDPNTGKFYRYFFFFFKIGGEISDGTKVCLVKTNQLISINLLVAIFFYSCFMLKYDSCRESHKKLTLIILV